MRVLVRRIGRISLLLAWGRSRGLLLHEDIRAKAKSRCDALIPGGPVDHRQPTKTCVSHIMRPIRE